MKSKSYNRGDKDFTQWEIRENGKGIQRLVDQNGQISQSFLLAEKNNKNFHILLKYPNYQETS
jgi:hypothetical protein